MHTHFSGDSDAPLSDMVAAAYSAGLPGITFTDHLDWDYFAEPGLFDLDYAGYLAAVHTLQRELDAEVPVKIAADSIASPETSQPFSAAPSTTAPVSPKTAPAPFRVLAGLELGLQPHLLVRHKHFLQLVDFDFIIGSVHVVDYKDPYYDDFYKNRTANQAYVDYFNAVLTNIQTFSDFDTLGHLDYIKRYVIKHFGSEDGALIESDYAEVIDEILKFLLTNDKALEVNTGSLRSGLTETNPSPAVLRRYHELGGKLITIGSDAHKPEHVALGFSDLPDMLHSCGFDSYVVYERRKPFEMPL